MSKQRRVNTAFWDDPYIESLSYTERYFFLFLLTNPHTNIAGIYEISIKKMCFYTGLKTDQIKKSLKKFICDNKILYKGNYVFMVNAIKHQMLSEKIVTGIKNIVESLPFDISSCVSIDKHRVYIDFEGLSNLHIDININLDINTNGNNIVLKEEEFDLFWNLYDKKVGDKKKIIKKFSELSKDDIAKIMIYIPKYKKAQPDKQFRKNPETFLNNESWNDEIIEKQKTEKPTVRV